MAFGRDDEPPKASAPEAGRGDSAPAPDQPDGANPKDRAMIRTVGSRYQSWVIPDRIKSKVVTACEAAVDDALEERNHDLAIEVSKTLAIMVRCEQADQHHKEAMDLQERDLSERRYFQLVLLPPENVTPSPNPTPPLTATSPNSTEQPDGTH